MTMMKPITIFDKTDGKILFSMTCDEINAPLYSNDETDYIEGDFPGNTHVIDGVAVKIVVPQTREELVSSISEKLAAHRYQIETSGITIGEIPVLTDRDSQSMISKAWAGNQISPKDRRFKTPEGFVTLTPEFLETIAVAVDNHVQKCFDTEDDVLVKMENTQDLTNFDVVHEWNVAWNEAG